MMDDFVNFSSRKTRAMMMTMTTTTTTTVVVVVMMMMMMMMMRRRRRRRRRKGEKYHVLIYLSLVLAFAHCKFWIPYILGYKSHFWYLDFGLKSGSLPAVNPLWEVARSIIVQCKHCIIETGELSWAPRSNKRLFRGVNCASMMHMHYFVSKHVHSQGQLFLFSSGILFGSLFTLGNTEG